MTINTPIHDLWIHPMETDQYQAADVWHVLGFEDHILRRLGALQIVRLADGSRTPLRLRETSDEVWALIEGKAAFYWEDLRADSPTRDQAHLANFDQPTTMLAPFGVAFGVLAVDGPALLVRLMADSETETGPARALPWPVGT
jgi:hypothetical protein